MTIFAQLTVQGIALGMVFALIALGFVIVLKGSHTLNFAHGEFVAFGAYMMLAMLPHVPWGIAFVVAVAAAVALALVVERLLLRKLVGREITTVVLATLGVSFMVHPLILMIWGVDSHGSVGPTGTGTVEVGSVILTKSGIATIAASLIAMAALVLFFRRTRYGLALRATASHKEAALAQGIDVGQMFALSWALAAVLAVLASVFLASFPRVVSPSMSNDALAAIPAIVIGGMDSLGGAVVGGLVVGLIQVLGARYLADYGGGKLHEVLPYMLMLAVLVIRPYGLFGSRSIERV